MKRFSKSFTQQDPIPEAGIEGAMRVLHSGRLHRYNVVKGEESEVSAFEREFAAYQGTNYCLACASCGSAICIALRASGLVHGDKVLANAYTLAPVPGAIHNAGGVPILVEINEDYHIDLADLRAKAESSGARYLLLSHMRGHIADMEAITALCDEFKILLIEDCAHTMGARWRGIQSGNFGTVACFSTQTYKHVNSGEGGLLTTNDPEIAARAVLLSGSYMLYGRHGAAPDEEVFRRIRLHTPNYSSRMDNLRAAILRPQLCDLDAKIARWNARYRVLEGGLRDGAGIRVPHRQPVEEYVGSSIQFFAAGLERGQLRKLVVRCADRGVELKWFGDDEPKGYTSRYDSWRYLGEQPELSRTLSVLAKTYDMRIPPTFSEDDCGFIAEIIADEVSRAMAEAGNTASPSD